MAEKLSLTTEAGTPVIDNQHSQTAGTGAHGVFEVTSPDVPRWTRMKMLARDPRGLAIKFPDFIHSQKPDPFSYRQ